MSSQAVDVIIVGAGLAGASAARQIARGGHSVLVLEARDRLGGRGFARGFGALAGEGAAGSPEASATKQRTGDADVLDYGGSWITPWQHRIRALCAEHGVELRPRHPIVERRWWREGSLHLDAPVAVADRGRHEVALMRLAADSARYKSGQATDSTGASFNGVSLAHYLAKLDAPQATLDLVSAWWMVSGNADKAISPATSLLGSLAYWDGMPDGICEVWTDTLVGGVTRLVERMLWQAGVGIELSAPVAEIAQNPKGVRVTVADGRVFDARAALISTGLNPMAGIRFTPPLANTKVHAVAVGHPGRAVKVWAKARGVAIGILATGGGRGIEWMFSERMAADGRALIVGFGVASDGWEARLPEDGIEAVQRFFPEARDIEIDAHDWIADPYARGTWVSSIVGEEDAIASATWHRDGRLAFASSDLAPEGQGWFDGAVISGEAAAGEIADVLR